MLINQATLDALRTEFSAIYGEAYAAAPSIYQQITTRVPSSTKLNTYGWIAQQLKLREWTGPRQALAISEHVTTVVNRKFEGTIKFGRDEIEDDNLFGPDIRTRQLGEATKKHPDLLIRDLLQLNSEAGPDMWDGVTLFHDTHPCFDEAGSTYDNNFGLALTADNFNTVRSSMATVKGEDGEVMGDNIHDAIMVAPQLQRAAAEIVGATAVVQIVGDETGSDNVAAVAKPNVMQGWATVIVNPYLANVPTRWYTMKLGGALKALLFQERSAPEFSQLTNVTDQNVFMLDEYLYGVRARHEVAATLPLLIATSKP